MKKLYIPILLALGAVACNRQPSGEPSSVPADARILRLDCRIEGQAATRADGDPIDFPSGGKIGLFICDHSDADPNPFTEHAPGYKNILATKNGSVWNFTYGGYSSATSILYLRAKKDEATNEPILTDVFAYAPYATSGNTDGVSTPHVVPFSVPGGDPLWCIENASPTINKRIDPTEVDEHGNKVETAEVKLTFRHALARIVCEVTVKNTQYLHPDGDGNAVKPGLSIVLKKGNASAHLYNKGTMDAFDGSITRSSEVTSYDLNGVNFESNSATTRTSIGQIIPTPPGEEYADGDYELEFKVGGLAAPVTFPILREHIRHGSSDVYGFQPGYIYTFHFIIDNYVHFSGPTVGTWEEVDTPLYEIEI